MDRLIGQAKRITVRQRKDGQTDRQTDRPLALSLSTGTWLAAVEVDVVDGSVVIDVVVVATFCCSVGSSFVTGDAKATDGVTLGVTALETDVELMVVVRSDVVCRIQGSSWTWCPTGVACDVFRCDEGDACVGIRVCNYRLCLDLFGNLQHLFFNICFTKFVLHLLYNVCYTIVLHYFLHNIRFTKFSPHICSTHLFYNICSTTFVLQHLFYNICSTTFVIHLFYNIFSATFFLLIHLLYKICSTAFVLHICSTIFVLKYLFYTFTLEQNFVIYFVTSPTFLGSTHFYLHFPIYFF